MFLTRLHSCVNIDQVQFQLCRAEPTHLTVPNLPSPCNPQHGLAGYLPLNEGNDLLSTLKAHSPPGSRIIVTVPPGPAVKAAKDKAQAALAQQTDSKSDVFAPVDMGGGAGGGVSTVQANMPHVTFEEPQDTLSRLT